MNRLYQSCLGVISGCFALTASAKLIIRVENPGGTARSAEVISVPYAEIARAFPHASTDHLIVHASDESVVPSQSLNFLPEEHRDNYVGIIFQHDFASGESSATFIMEQTPVPVPPFPTQVFARYVPERFDDFAWENDRIAHRAYGPALNTPAAGKEQMSASGVDVWCKRVRYPIVDRWYLRGHYHEDTGEGLDMYDVGTSRGCGGSGIWDGKTLQAPGNWKAWRVLANGPIRAVFELSYGPFQVSGQSVTEVKRFTVDAGHNLDQVEDTYSWAGDAERVVGIGMTKHQGKPATAATDPNAGWISRWETFPDHGSIGCGIVPRPDEVVAGTAETSTDQLLLLKAKSGTPLHYAIGAGWSLSGDFPDLQAWTAYLKQAVVNQRNSIRVSISVE